MDHTENQFQLLTICQKLFNIIKNCVASQTDKTITLSNLRLGNKLAETPYSVESQGSSNAGAERNPSTPSLSCRGLNFKEENSVGKLSPNDHGESPPGNSISGDVNNERVHSCYDNPGEKEQQNPILGDLSQERGVRKVVSFDHKVEIFEGRKRKLKKIRSTERMSLVEYDDNEIITPLKPILKMGSGLDATSDPSAQQPDEAETS